MNFFLQIKLWIFNRFFKKLVGHSMNEDQRDMFIKAESGKNVTLNFSRSAGASTFLIVYAHFKKEKGKQVIVIGSRHVRTLAETYLKATRRFPIILHNSSYASSLKPEILLIDQSKDLSTRFKTQVIDKLTGDGVKVVNIDTA